MIPTLAAIVAFILFALGFDKWRKKVCREEAIEDFKARRTIQDCGWPEDKP